MIYSIKGKITEKFLNKLIIQTKAGISFEVIVSPKFASSVDKGQEIELITVLVITEKFLGIYGFENLKKKEIFTKLESISGIGHRLAYNIVSFADIEELAERCRIGDVEYFAQIPGIGKKTAQKVIVELSQIFESELSLKSLFLDKEDKLLFEALRGLGYRVKDIRKILPEIEKNLPLEERIKQALKKLSLGS